MQGNMTAADALQKLKEGNAAYLTAETGTGDISPATRSATCESGQKPYAVIVACSDSRVIPEYIFSTGIGELFVVRVAGNVIDKHQLGSIEYAVEHLGCKLVMVLGHTHCGAVGAAVKHSKGYVKYVAHEIRHAIGTETDATKASVLNTMHSVNKIRKHLHMTDDVQVAGALYHTESGVVDFDIDG